MNLLDSLDGLSYVEFGRVLVEALVLEQQAQHVPSSKIFHHKVQVVIVLKGVLQVGHPGGVEETKQIPLLHEKGLLAAQHLCLVQLLDRVVLVIRLAFHQVYLSDTQWMSNCHEDDR